MLIGLSEKSDNHSCCALKYWTIQSAKGIVEHCIIAQNIAFDETKEIFDDNNLTKI